MKYSIFPQISALWAKRERDGLIPPEITATLIVRRSGTAQIDGLIF